MSVTVKKNMEYAEYNLIRNALMDNIPSKVDNCEYMKNRKQAVFKFSDSVYVPDVLKNDIMYINTVKDDMIELNSDIHIGFMNMKWEYKGYENPDNDIKMDVYEDEEFSTCVDINAKCSCGAEKTIMINPEEIEYKVH